MKLPQAIHKITGFPARRFGIARRGLLEHGGCADITVFDPNAIDSKATYLKPAVPPVGIRYVFRNRCQLGPYS